MPEGVGMQKEFELFEQRGKSILPKLFGEAQGRPAIAWPDNGDGLWGRELG
jgi:hypothetical protein